MSISASQVKELREKTGVGMMECKKALQESDGDMEKAVVWLRERGMARAQKKAGRAAAEGVVEVRVSDDQKSGLLLEVNSETDFVAKNEDFQKFVDKVSQFALENGVTSADELVQKELDGKPVGDQLTELIAKIGENMRLRRLEYLSVDHGVVTGYSHMGGKIGSLVALEGPEGQQIQDLGKDLAMHVAASSPRYMYPDDVPENEIEQEKQIARKRLEEEGKKPDLIEKILVGQMKKYCKEICFLEQPFVKDPNVSVSKYVESVNKECKVKNFHRFQLGEGVEKKDENFAEEVKAQLT